MIIISIYLSVYLSIYLQGASPKLNEIFKIYLLLIFLFDILFP